MKRAKRVADVHMWFSSLWTLTTTLITCVGFRGCNCVCSLVNSILSGSKMSLDQLTKHVKESS